MGLAFISQTGLNRTPSIPTSKNDQSMPGINTNDVLIPGKFGK